MGSLIIAKQFVSIVITETIAEFRENPINERSVLTGLVFFGSLSVLGASVLKSLVVGVCSPSAPLRPIEGLFEGRISGSS